MDKNIKMSLMLDFYGGLLTKRQEEILKMYCDQDLSLGEISQNLGITRQGVFDTIKRTERILYKIEDKLGLVERFLEKRRKAAEVLGLINQIEFELKDKELKETCKKIDKIKNLLNIIIEEN